MGVPLPLSLPVALADNEAVEVAEGLAPRERLGVGEPVCVELALRVEVGVGGGVGVALGVGVPEEVALRVGGGVPLLDSELLPVWDGEAPLVREGVGEALTVELAESVEEGVEAAVPVPLVEGVPVEVPEGVWDAVALLEKDVLGVLLAEAPGLSEAVGEADTVELAESVVDGVGAGVPVPLPVGVAVGVGVGVLGGVALLERLVLPVLDWEAPLVREAVGEAERVEEALAVVEGVGAAVPVPLGVGLGVPVPLGVGEGVREEEKEVLGVGEGEAPLAGEAVGGDD